MGSQTLHGDAADFRSEDVVVVDLGDAIHWVAFGYAAAPNDPRASAAWDDAERKLIRALQLGELVALGFRHGRGERQEIPARFWIDAELEPLESYAFRQWSRENEWEQVRLYRRDIVQLWPSPLSAIRDEPTNQTLPLQPDEISVADTQPWWSLTAVVAWILARDPSAVAALHRPRLAVDKGAILLRLSRQSDKILRTARGELTDALAAAEVTAYGDRGTGNGPQPVPAVQWSRPPEYLLEDGTDRAGPYRDVVIARAEVLQRWPEHDRPLIAPSGTLLAAGGQTDQSRSRKTIKRKGGRSAPWVKDLRKYLQLRCARGDDLETIRLIELRTDFLSYAMTRHIRKVPKARSWLDIQISGIRLQVIAEFSWTPTAWP